MRAQGGLVCWRRGQRTSAHGIFKELGRKGTIEVRGKKNLESVMY